MAALLLLLQLALPLALLGWLALRPTGSKAGFTLQLAATAAVLLALSLSGLWLLPPWWMQWVYWALFAAAALLAMRRARPKLWPTGLDGWATAALLLGIGGYGAWTAAAAWQGRQMPAAPAVELAFPLPPGRYLVVNGGSNAAVSSHAMTLDPTVPRFRRWRGQSYGVDIVGVDRLGLPARGLSPSDPARYRIFGTPILAPCNGRVIAAVDGVADTIVPQMDRAHMSGNHVILACDGAHILLAHMRRGSVAVRPGQSVRTGRRLGEVGNSGNSSSPHLHIHAQTPGTAAEPIAAAPLPLRLDGRYPVRGDRF